jgi:peptidyl-prolyl cis-trans isomerase A (cyclophilin A)/peptidyl-prolyl cis-trans isomerase B (cyclophilin B)
MRSLTYLIFGLLLWSSQAFAAGPLIEIKTSAGDIRIELYPAKAPKTVANFLQYVRDGAYAGTQFHRVIRGFMIQGGGFDRNFHQMKTRAPIENEAGNGLKNATGTIAMARTSDPNSATAQFFINVADNDALNFREPSRAGYGYAVFGRVVRGMDVVMRIASTPTGAGGPFSSDVPQQPVIVESVSVISSPDVSNHDVSNPDVSKR